MTDDMLQRADEEVDTIRAALKSLGYLRIEEGKGAVLMELLQELSTRVREQEWQPIATAPKDGTDILISMYNIRGEYQGQNIAGWSKWDEDGYETEPHWAVTCGKYGGGGLSYVDSTFSQWKRVVEPPKPIQAKSLRKK